MLLSVLLALELEICWWVTPISHYSYSLVGSGAKKPRDTPARGLMADHQTFGRSEQNQELPRGVDRSTPTEQL